MHPQEEREAEGTRGQGEVLCSSEGMPASLECVLESWIRTIVGDLMANRYKPPYLNHTVNIVIFS